jgi:hypothetical protein
MEKIVSSERYDIEWHGPFTVAEVVDENNKQLPLIHTPGLYLWTIKHENGYLVYYIGETTQQTLTIRLQQHVLAYLVGQKRIYEPTQFSKAEKVLIWGGTRYRSQRIDFADFINEYSRLAPGIASLLQYFRIFLASSFLEQRIIRRIGAGIASNIRAKSGIIGNFQDADVRFESRLISEELFGTKFKFPKDVVVLGLDDTIMA